MKINVLASGSKGNSTLLEVENEKILIDLGISNKKLEEKLKEISVDVNEINDVLI